MAKHHKAKKEKVAEKQSVREEQRKAAMKENALRKMKRNIIISVLVLIGLALLITLIGTSKVSTEGLPELSLTSVAPTDIALGSNPEIILIEYSDYQCPACRSAEPLVKAIIEKYGDNITFIYRDFPLKQIHPKAAIGAQAAQAAGKQDAYWEMHDILFERQDEWVKGAHFNLFTEYATEIGLNVTQFEADLTSDEVKALVENNYQHGLSIGIQGTPSFFLNGKRVQATGLDDFTRRIDPLLV